uniref:Cytochrome c oxidase subunit 3 n=1 Tax=Paramphistomum cervi TaxID=762801 RepID=V5K9A0_PARCE|nr:cytochrome c oxidase subunit III [Paramphistomum cervi]AGV52536.1 cytochrome c oxidase subunit 3 [Paramphistomum cervi]ALC75052.1 cytochrome c oxidase subunit 3 [Paramphistomum cervi]
MSWLPLYNAWIVCLALVSLFLWKLLGVVVLLVALFLSLSYLLKESLGNALHYVYAFWLFIMTEVLIFGSLFVAVFWNESCSSEAISSFLELPFLGCFLLIGSSLTVTAYHHSVGLASSSLFLLLTLFLGFSFVVLQVFEVYDCECDWVYSVYYAACFSTVGLHFLHVVIGLVGLAVIFVFGDVNLNVFYNDVVIWYWHFVDYIWLLVYLVVYLS